MKKYYLLILSILLISALTVNAQKKIAGSSGSDLKVLGTENKSGGNPLLNTKDLLGNISKSTAGLMGRNIFDPGKLSDEEYSARGMANASSLYSQNTKSVVLLIAPDGSSLGSGCIISSDGRIVTNWHVIEGQSKMYVYFYDKNITNIEEINIDKAVLADVVAADLSKDLAMVKLNTDKTLFPLKMADASDLEVAQDVFAIGHPDSYIWSFTYGVISQFRNKYEWTYDNVNFFHADIIQTQTPINPGNSGGPLFNTEGEWIGINSFGSPGTQGINFAVKINEIKDFIKQVEQGKFTYSAEDKTEPPANYEWELFDSNNNGIADGEGIDENGDGYYDVTRMDENEDGVVDYILGDLNYDTIIDVEVYDQDGDGYFEYFLIDSDYDGYIDTVGIDTNSDGEPDQFSDYTG